MKLLTDFYASPARVQGLLRLLSAHGSSMACSDVSAWMEAALENPGGEKKASSIAAAAIDAGLVRVIDEPSGPHFQLMFHAPPEDWVDNRLSGALNRHLAKVLLRSPLNTNGNQLATLTAWMMTQTHSSMPQGHARIKDAINRSGYPIAEFGLSNDACVDNLLYWLRYLGFLWRYEKDQADGLVPDPTQYMTWHLDELLPHGEVRTVTDFCNQLGGMCPVLDGGAVRNAVLEHLTRHGQPRLASDQLSSTLSFALRRLQRAGKLRYWCPADQRSFMVLSHGEKIAFLERQEGRP